LLFEHDRRANASRLTGERLRVRGSDAQQSSGDNFFPCLALPPQRLVCDTNQGFVTHGKHCRDLTGGSFRLRPTPGFQRARISIKAMPIIEIAEECRALIESAIESPTGRRHLMPAKAGIQ
jgi:hypothetical protein